MTLQEIASFIQNTTRYKLSPEQVILLIDATQKLAFDNDSKMFLVWSTFTPYFELTFSASGYTSAIAGDIGKTVVGGTTGAQGVLVSYNNTTRIWKITNTNAIEFTDEAITITTGTGAGTATDFAGFKGPYTAPTSPPTRKVWGITRETDTRIYGSDETISTDYNFNASFDPSNFFEQARLDSLNNQITLIQAPTINSVYRWVYWRDAETITDILPASDTKLLIPVRYHMQFINACKKQADVVIFGEDLNPDDIKALLGNWWTSQEAPHTPMGKVTNQQLWPRQSSKVLI